jgi:Metallo-beta-lactamase superfamily
LVTVPYDAMHVVSRRRDDAITVYYCPNPHENEWRTLRTGDRCPVCGSELKPRADVPTDVTEAEAMDALHDLALEMDSRCSRDSSAERAAGIAGRRSWHGDRSHWAGAHRLGEDRDPAPDRRLAGALRERPRRGRLRGQLLGHVRPIDGDAILPLPARGGQPARLRRRPAVRSGANRALGGVGSDFEVIPTPGHTAGATAYLWDSGDRRVLFTGDTIFLDNKECVLNLRYAPAKH